MSYSSCSSFPTDGPCVQYREAFEEIALDTKSSHLRTVTTLPPFVSAKKLIVTPTIALLAEPSVLKTLIPGQGEVDLIFDHPVRAFLDPTVVAGDKLAPKGSEQWKWESELHVRQQFFHELWMCNSEDPRRISKIMFPGL